MKKNFILKLVLVCISLCINLNARTQTTAYQTYLGNGVFSATQAPTGEVRFPAEFEPVQSVMVAYPLELPWELLQRISNLEDCKLITVVNKRKTNSTIDEIKNEYTNNGVNIDNCEFIIAKNDNLEDGINSHWMRDFGPWCIFHGKNVAIVDNVYNRSFVDDNSNPIADEYLRWDGKPRWRDDAFAKTYATNNNIPLYGMEVVHTGGNMMQDGRGVGVSDLIVHTESEDFVGLSKETVNQRMKDYLGINPYHVTIDPQGDYIAHVDCWGKFLAPDKIIIARVPESHERYSAYEEVASYFAGTECCWGYPYKVYRVDIPVTKKDQIHDADKIAPYTNSLIVNKTVFVPISSQTSADYNNAALAVYREAMPGYEIIGINYSGWKNTDALHCRTRDIMDFKMLFVDHRNVLFGEQAYKESYPITAKFIAYSGDNITETKLHYSINGGEYTTVDMQQVGTTDEYTGNITGVKTGDVVRYYITGKDNSNRTCAQPQFCGENSQYNNSESHTFTVGVASEEDNEGEEPEQPTTPVSVTISADNNSVTVNESVQLNATAIGGTGNYTYSWSPATAVDNATIANPTFTPNTTGEYTFTCTVTDNGVTATSNTVTITVNEAQQGGTSSDVVTIDGTVGSYTQTTSMNVPIYNNYEYAVTQQYYLQSEIGKDGGTITKIAFKTATTDGHYPYTRNIDIYMVNTDDSYFDFDTKESNVVSSSDLVFSGVVEFTKNEWINITLENSFIYNGKNILLCINDKTSDYHGNKDGGAGYFDVYQTKVSSNDNYRAIYKGTSSGALNPQNTINNVNYSVNVPYIQFTFGAAQVDPITISANPSKVFVGDDITFTVMQGSSNVTANAKFYIGEEEISNPYTTTSAGTFTVRAEKDGLTSETTFTVVEPNPINLYVNPSEVLVGKNIKFTVTQVDINGTEQDVTNDSRFYIEETNTEVLSTYTTETAGTFTVRAEKDGLTATKTFTVVNPIILTATPSTVTVGEEIKFTVMQGDNDVTSEATLYIGTTIISNPYTTTTAGTYTVYAQKGTLTSESITITVNEVQQGGGDTSSDVVTIDGSVGNYSQTEARIPVDIYNCVSLSQQYYTKEEIGKDNGNITHIAFHTTNNGDFGDNATRSIEIYIINTPDSYFTVEHTIALSEKDMVFDGTITFIKNDWVKIELEKSFYYEGNNILVCVNDVTKNAVSKESLFKTFHYGSNPYRAYYLKNWNTSCSVNPYNPTKENSSSIIKSEEVPFIQLTFGDASTPEVVNPTISVDKTRFTADDSDYVKFTVKPEDAEIWYTTGTQNAVQLTTTDKSFKTSNAGTYSFYATKDGVSSDPITVEAVAEKELTLTLSKNSIVANGIDEVTFTVKQVDVNGTEQDVTNNCTFKINGTAITGNTFFTNRAGEYTVTAAKGTKTATAAITATAVSGEENVVLIDGNVMQPADQSYNYSLTNPLSVPVNNYYSYSISQQYYTKGEIGKDEGVITHIAFKTAKTAGTYTRDIEVYMVNADESTFSSKELKQMSGTNKVYSGEVQFSSNSWITLPLSNSFKYTGKNVLICVNDKTGTKETYLTSHFDAYALGSNVDRVVYMHSDNMLNPTAANTGNTFVYFAPFVKFTFEQELPIVLEGSKQIVKADGSDIIRFSVKQGGNYVTGKTKIYVEQYEGSTIISTTVLNDTTFATSNVGTYRAYAKKDDLTSNNVEFTSVYPIVLTADKTTIIADGNDAVTFTLMQNDIDVTIAEGTVIYVGNNVITNTFATSTMGTYMAYATRDGIRSNGIEITVNDKNYDGSEGVAGGSENEYYNGDGSITYNKGEENEYTLIAKKINNTTAYIKQDNVKVNATGDYYWRFDQNKPHAETILTIPEKILFGDEWITITKIEDFAFSDKCDLSEDGRQVFEPGNPLNSNFTGVIIPSTITEIGTYTFGFTIEEYVICFAKTPPALSETTVNNPFYKNTYDNVILYVPAESIDDYRKALGWGAPFMGGDEYYFKNIYPITMPTYVEKEKDNLIWDNANNWRTYVKIDDDNYEERYGVMPEEGVDVLIDGNVRITNGCEANVGAVHIITGSITIADGGQLIHTNAGVNVTLEKEIIGYYESTSPTSWYTISSPLFNSVKASSVINLLENDYDLYRYDEPTHYWDNIEDPEGLGGGPVGAWETLDAARGYLYANQKDVTLQFKGIANHIGGNYNLTRDAWDGVLLGFHLVGNPFTHNIYMNNAFDTEATLADGYYILSNTGAWGANLGSNTPIEPCQGVLIKAMTEGTLTINKKVGPATEAQTRSRSKDEFIAISVANKNYEDKAYVSFNAENPLEKVNHQNKDIPMVYIPMEEDNYAIATMDNDVKEIPVAFEAKTMGQYTIGATAENCEFKNMYLVDKLTGIETNLLLESYTFMATTTDNSKRFIIKLSNNDLDTENFIFINNNEMIINNIEGKGVLQIFDVMGRYISHTEVSGSANISTEAFTSGVYIIRITDDNGVKTQKVVLY